MIKEFRHGGLRVKASDNDVEKGMFAVRSRLEVSSGGVPFLTVAPKCVRLIHEFESYCWKKLDGREVPMKVDDHGPDALRYACISLQHPVRGATSYLSGMTKASTSDESKPTSHSSTGKVRIARLSFTKRGLLRV